MQEKKKTFGKIQQSFMIKSFSEFGIERNYPNIIKAVYKMPIANIISNGERLKAFPLISGTSKECLLSPFTFNLLLDIQARGITQKKKKKKKTKGPQ